MANKAGMFVQWKKESKESGRDYQRKRARVDKRTWIMNALIYAGCRGALINTEPDIGMVECESGKSAAACLECTVFLK